MLTTLPAPPIRNDKITDTPWVMWFNALYQRVGGAVSQAFDFAQGEWAPTFTGLTVVGTATYSGRYWKSGNLLEFEVTIVPEAGATTAALRGTTFISNLPFTTARFGTLTAIDCVTRIRLAEGVVDSGGTSAYMPTWDANPNTIVIMGSVQVAG